MKTGISKRRRPIAIVVASLGSLMLFATQAQAATSLLDPTFGNRGRVTADFGGTADRINVMAIQPDGKILVGGTVAPPNSNQPDVKILRYQPDGTPDVSFGTDGQLAISYPRAFSAIDSLVVQPDGAILTSTRGYSFDTDTSYAAVSRYRPDGTLDPSFGDGGTLPGRSGQLALQPGGRILLLGTSLEENVVRLMRFNRDGSIDRRFGVDGDALPVLDDTFFDELATVRGGRILVSARQRFSGLAVAELTPNGGLVKRFGNGGVATLDPGGDQSFDYQVGAGPHGSVLVGAYSSHFIPTTYTEGDLVRFTRRGEPDPGFGTDGLVRTTFVRFASLLGFASDAEGRIVATISTLSAARHDFVLARYLQDGSLDPTFGDGGIVDAQLGSSGGSAWPIAIQPDGAIVAAGWLNNGADDDFAVARFLA